MNTTDFLSISSAICPDRNAIVFEGKSHTYAGLAQRANRLANALAQLGVGQGDRVAILQVNCNQYVESYFAIAKLGAVMVPLNFRAKQDELSYMLQNAEAHTLLLGQRYVDLARLFLPHLPQMRHIITMDSKAAGMLFYEDLLASASGDEVFTEIGDNDLTILMYTSGTSGRPKGVPITHNAFVSYVLDNVEPASPDVAEVTLLTVPLYHVAGIQAMMAAIYGGRTLVLMRQFEVNEWLEMVQRERVSRVMLVPTMLKWVVDHPEFNKFDISSLKVVTYGAAPMPFEVIKKAIEMLPDVRFINAFGQTETASTICMLGPDDHVLKGLSEAEKAKKLKRLQCSIGRAMADVKIRIADPETGRALSPGESGEIQARGPRVMGGYWKDAEKTAKAMTSDGWLKTGDMGYMDEEGYIYLAGRGDDLIIRGGENISPEEIENVLYRHPAVEECAVIGVPDPEWGQEPRAIVVIKKDKACTPDDLMEFCRIEISGFKRPRSVVFVESLPRNQMGKVLRRVLREQYGKP